MVYFPAIIAPVVLIGLCLLQLFAYGILIQELQMSFCYTIITPDAFPCASINWGWWLPPWIEPEAVYTFGLMEMDLWISSYGYMADTPHVSGPAFLGG